MWTMTFRHICLLGFGALLFSGAAYAEQQRSTPTREQAPLQVPNPHYVTISESVIVNAPVEKVWTRVGKFCDITEWMNSPEGEDCKYLQGNGGPGSVRSIVNEVLVGQTQYSYTCAQPPRKNTLYNLAHGTLAAEALTPTTMRLSYTMLRDDSELPDEPARQRDADGRRARCSEWLKNMKVLAEGGKLPPKPAGILRPPITTPFLNPNSHYASLPMSIVVDAPVEKVWERVGKTGTASLRAETYDEAASKGTGLDLTEAPGLNPKLSPQPAYDARKGAARFPEGWIAIVQARPIKEAMLRSIAAIKTLLRGGGSSPRIACPVANASMSVPHFTAWIFSSSNLVSNTCADASGDCVSIAYRTGPHAVVSGVASAGNIPSLTLRGTSTSGSPAAEGAGAALSSPGSSSSSCCGSAEHIWSTTVTSRLASLL